MCNDGWIILSLTNDLLLLEKCLLNRNIHLSLSVRYFSGLKVMSNVAILTNVDNFWGFSRGNNWSKSLKYRYCALYNKTLFIIFYSYNLSFSNAIVFAGYEVHTTIVITTDFRLSDYHLPVARIGQHWQSVAARAGLSTAHSSAHAAAPGLLAPPSGGGLPIKKIMWDNFSVACSLYDKKIVACWAIIENGSCAAPYMHSIALHYCLW